MVLETSEDERRTQARRAREFALAFDRVRIFDDLFRTPIHLVGQPGWPTALWPRDEETA